ncbi:sensor histidine kinase [Acetatifactor muris]|uniref:sensor histidine kinase n=1 Tax=Acetatifactor muris TaxID=879566 RepID=UPI0023F515D6|nr:HAMP domain-containing sensor histidine kinase [Acetatifactor muris]MCI8800430.1 GHKL domain-containing protein [Lachnospiraceae bacterium]
MRHSIRRQFALIFIGLMAGTIFLCWFMNIMFLEQFYIRSKTEIIFEAYQSIRQAANSDTYSTEEFRQELNEVCGVYNITIYVMDVYSNVKYASANGGSELERKLMSYLFGFFPDVIKVIREGEGYQIQKVLTGDNEYLEMFGRLSSGISFIMRTPVESIRESVKVANHFLAYIGVAATLTGGIIIWLVSRKITKPILELNYISEKMVHLDFEAKYKGAAHNEIDLLGENINKLSLSLEKSISELKTANNELQTDIKKKEQIDEMRKEFLANVSHELKTPIALIQGYAEGLSEGINDDPESRNFYCEVIMDEAGKMNNMVQKLLTLNQLEFGNDVVAMERFDITELVRNYVQSAAILTKQNGIEVYMEEYPPVFVWGDPDKVQEVFTNYFSNAVNHCSGKKIIVITLEQKEAQVRIGVFNTGETIPQEALPRLWEKFYKVDKARTREYGGSGVGLSIVKAIMDSMNRQYGVENYNNGVLFWFELEKV